MRVLGALVLLMGLTLGFWPGSASASPCPRHLQADEAQVTPSDQSFVVPSAEVVATATPDLSKAPAPKPLLGHVMPDGQPCCHHAAPAAAPAYGPALGPHVRTGRRIALRSFMLRRPSPTFGIYRPPTTT